jgi:hypothetical protein
MQLADSKQSMDQEGNHTSNTIILVGWYIGAITAMRNLSTDCTFDNAGAIAADYCLGSVSL